MRRAVKTDGLCSSAYTYMKIRIPIQKYFNPLWYIPKISLINIDTATVVKKVSDTLYRLWLQGMETEMRKRLTLSKNVFLAFLGF